MPHATTTPGATTTGTPASAQDPAHRPHLPADSGVGRGDAGQHLIGTRDADLIRAWASHHGAEPATGEETPSGPATLDVNDHGTGLRFNFPAAARFRRLTWDEWMECFERDALVFVFEGDRDGESALSRFGGAYFRLVPRSQWGDAPLASLAP